MRSNQGGLALPLFLARSQTLFGNAPGHRSFSLPPRAPKAGARRRGSAGVATPGLALRFPPACPAGSGGPRQGDELDRRKCLGPCRLGKFVSATPLTPPARRETKAGQALAGNACPAQPAAPGNTGSRPGNLNHGQGLRGCGPRHVSRSRKPLAGTRRVASHFPVPSHTVPGANVTGSSLLSSARRSAAHSSHGPLLLQARKSWNQAVRTTFFWIAAATPANLGRCADSATHQEKRTNDGLSAAFSGLEG
jgi:hypothetical protein